MKDYIEQFPAQLEEAIQIATNTTVTPQQNNIQNVVVLGLGGSAFGGEIVSNYIASQCKVPFFINREYDIPAFVGKHTLVITCSYSGNTEETLSAFDQASARGAEIVCITSGGKLKGIAEERGLSYAQLPGGYPPRTAAGFSVVQQLNFMHAYGLIEDYSADLAEAIQLLKDFAEHDAVRALAKELKGKIPAIYANKVIESVAIRWRQQIAENAKQLGWHHIVPEMNHNELVGWHYPEGLMDSVHAIFLESGFDHERNAIRAKINQEIIKKHTQNVSSVAAKGESHLGQIFYLLHFGDWLSLYLAEENDVDPIPVKVIDYLKGELAKV